MGAEGSLSSGSGFPPGDMSFPRVVMEALDIDGDNGPSQDTAELIAPWGSEQAAPIWA
jgi:hypothetical protein